MEQIRRHFTFVLVSLMLAAMWIGVYAGYSRVRAEYDLWQQVVVLIRYNIQSGHLAVPPPPEAAVPAPKAPPETPKK